jgi:hypothetical protein
MKNTITWVKAAKDYHEKSSEQLVPFGTALINQLAIDPDVPVAGIPAPLTPATYTTMISGLNTDVVARQTSRATTLTSDELSKGSTLIHNTDILVGYIDQVCNQKFPGNVAQITTVLARFGLTPVGHGTGSHKHIFRILSVAGGSATVEAPAEGAGSVHHWRWSTDQATWHQVKSTHKAVVTIINLPHDVRVYFQYDFSPPVGKGVYPTVDANAADVHWSSSISEVIPASTTTGNNNML